jgi:hypothetical protein
MDAKIADIFLFLSILFEIVGNETVSVCRLVIVDVGFLQ